MMRKISWLWLMLLFVVFLPSLSACSRNGETDNPETDISGPAFVLFYTDN